MLTNKMLSKINPDDVLNQFDGSYIQVKKQLKEIYDSDVSNVEKTHKTMKIIRHWFRTGGKS